MTTINVTGLDHYTGDVILRGLLKTAKAAKMKVWVKENNPNGPLSFVVHRVRRHPRYNNVQFKLVDSWVWYDIQGAPWLFYI